MHPRSETLATGNKSAIKNEIICNKELPEEINKPHIREFNKRKAHSPFINKLWGSDLDLVDMQLIRKFNKDLDFCCVLLIFIVNIHGLFF